MPYDPALDKELGNREVEVNGTIFIVSLRSYNGGEPKVSISQKDSRFPVRRMTPAQYLAIADVVRELAAEGTAQ